MIVLKFGGTSVENAKAISMAARIIEKEKHRSPLIVVSACAGVTDVLDSITTAAINGSVVDAREGIRLLYDQHLAIAGELLDESNQAQVRSTLAEDRRTLHSLISILAQKREAPGILRDRILSYGEGWSSDLLKLALLESGVPAILIPATSVLATNEDHGQANPLFDETVRRAKNLILPLFGRGFVVVTQGFIGSTVNGVTTTLGRGGSDYSATLLGAALDAEEIQIWTDVDGILSADPAVVPNTTLIESIPFDRATELAHYGAKVIHPRTFLPVASRNIPVRILNSRNPDSKGSLITFDINEPHNAATRTKSCIESISSKRNICLVSSTNSIGASPSDFLEMFVRQISLAEGRIESLVHSEIGISAVVQSISGDGTLKSTLQALGEMTTFNHKAIVCVVGKDLPAGEVRENVNVLLRQAGITVHRQFEGVTDQSIGFVVDEDSANAAVQLLHDRFIVSSERTPQRNDRL